MFTESLEGIVLIKRGNCWFHTKAVNAQAAGAAAVIVYNDKAQMVDIMEGVDELPSLMIPTVLVDGPAFESVKQMVGTPISMTKRGFDGEDIHRPLATSVVFRCSTEWYSRPHICQKGDEVDVKVPPPAGHIPGAKWPNSAVRILKAVIDSIDYGNETMQVTWIVLAEGGDQDVSDLSPMIPSRWAYYQGVPCHSVGSSRIELISEPQACQTDFVVHVAELCSHPRLAPPQPIDPQVISCTAHGIARDVIARHRGAIKGEAAGEQQVAASD